MLTCHEPGSPVNRTPHPNRRCVIAGVSLVLLLAACGSSASTSKTAAPTVPVSIAASSTVAAGAAATPTTVAVGAATTPTTVAAGAATTAKAAAGGASGCVDAALAVDKVIGTSADVTGIKVIGGCMVSVATSLQPGAAGASAALALCDRAAEAAYAAGAKSISFDSIAKHELAAGIKGSPCIGEP